MANTLNIIDLSVYNQLSFIGGMNLLGDDTRLQPNQYRAGFNLTNRYDELDPILESQEDFFINKGIIQEMTTFGSYEIIFISGFAYYKFYTDTGWKQISGFQMSTTAPRFWSIAIPVSTTNYVRYAATGSLASTSDSSGAIQLSTVAGAAAGNLPGLLVQDNINQPQFIFINSAGIPEARTTQDITKWAISFTDNTNTVVNVISDIEQDFREYVPIGNSMTWEDSTLYITSQDFNFIYRSVSGRPLDFVVNVLNTLATNAAPVTLAYPTTTQVMQLDGLTIQPFTQVAGGDATTTSYSVGVGGISCLRAMSSGGIFVAASNANFSVTKNKTPNAPTIFGEYTFIRTFLFNANCLSDRVIFDSTGDTRFIDLSGVRSFNAIQQQQNEGRNSVFTATISRAFSGITQDPSACAGILYDNYELYGVNTIFGPALVKYDTINSCWTSFDVGQTDGKLIKILTKIELAIQAAYAVTVDNRLFRLYVGPETAMATFRSIGICASFLYANSNIKMNNPKNEIKPTKTRVILNNITGEEGEVVGLISLTQYINNRISKDGLVSKNITYQSPATPSNSSFDLPDVDTQLNNILWTSANSQQGWKMFDLFSWNIGSITQFVVEMKDEQPSNSVSARGLVT